MKSNFSEQELKERTLELLYGLLEENEAEELRRLIASDATAARIFDEARETVERFARAARWEEEPETEVDETAAKNVAVEAAPFDGGASLAFDSALIAGDAFSANVDGEPAKTPNVPETEGESSGSNRKRAKRRLKLLRKLKMASKNERSDNDVNVGKRGGLGKERRRKKAGRPANVARPATASRFRFGSKGRVDGESGWATVGRTASGEGGRRSAARRFWARVPKPTLFQNLIIALAVVALSTAVGFWAQESALQARFRDDFRIQIAAPRTLARGASQTILATTTAPNGKPRRVPIRFAFSDAETGTPLLAHTESGDASGVARFKIPDVSDFPARTRLTISAGEREQETFETILTVVDAPKAKGGTGAAARFAASKADVAVFLSTAPSRRAAANPMAADVPTLAAASEGAGGEKERSARSTAMVGGMTGASVASKSDGAMDAMGASVSAASREDAVAFDARETKAEAASWEARTETFNLADQDSRKFDRASAAGAEPLALDDKSSADDESAFMFSVSGDDKKETPTDGAEPAFNFPTAVSCEKAAASLGMNAMTAAPVSSQDERREAALEKAKANFSALADCELVDEPDADATVATEKRGLDVRFYPTGGRLVAGRENVVWFECVDADGRPDVGEFALNDSTGRVATAKTSEGGVGSLRWTPDADETYSLETAFNGKVAKIVETDKIVKNDKAGGEEERVAAEEAALGAFALNDTCEDFHPAEPPFETFRFAAPTATVERVAFSVPSRVLDAGKSVEFEIWCENEAPLAATVEKNGVALAQRVWTAKKGRRRVVVPLDSDVSGVLNVSLWNCARTPFEKVGSASVYRKPTVAPPTLAATLERNDGGRRALRVAVERQKDWENAEPVGLEAFWSPTLDDALAALELDETLLYASDERRAETLATLEPPTAAEPVLFDNLLEMKENALKKLNAFWLGEAGLAGRVVGLGFAGCGALALLTVFCVLFGALKARRGAVVVLFCAALATFFYFERRRIDFSETLLQAIAVSVDESKAAAQRRDATDGGANANASTTTTEETTAPKREGRETRTLFWVDFDSKPANAAEWNVPLPENLATTEGGYILTKVVASDGTFAWKAIPLAENDGEGTE